MLRDYSLRHMSNESRARKQWTLGNIPFVILFGSLAVIYATEQNWPDSAIWGGLAVAMLLTHGLDLSRPGAWRKPRYVLGGAFALAAVAVVVVRLVMTLVR